MKIIIGGHYQHYKGKKYTILHLARNSETLEDLIVYQAEYGTKEIWVRPEKMFLELVNGEPRFKLLEDIVLNAANYVLGAVEAEDHLRASEGAVIQVDAETYQKLLSHAETLARWVLNHEAIKTK